MSSNVGHKNSNLQAFRCLQSVQEIARRRGIIHKGDFVKVVLMESDHGRVCVDRALPRKKQLAELDRSSVVGAASARPGSLTRWAPSRSVLPAATASTGSRRRSAWSLRSRSPRPAPGAAAASTPLPRAPQTAGRVRPESNSPADATVRSTDRLAVRAARPVVSEVPTAEVGHHLARSEILKLHLSLPTLYPRLGAGFRWSRVVHTNN